MAATSPDLAALTKPMSIEHLYGQLGRIDDMWEFAPPNQKLMAAQYGELILEKLQENELSENGRLLKFLENVAKLDSTDNISFIKGFLILLNRDLKSVAPLIAFIKPEDPEFEQICAPILTGILLALVNKQRELEGQNIRDIGGGGEAQQSREEEIDSNLEADVSLVKTLSQQYFNAVGRRDANVAMILLYDEAIASEVPDSEPPQLAQLDRVTRVYDRNKKAIDTYKKVLAATELAPAQAEVKMRHQQSIEALERALDTTLAAEINRICENNVIELLSPFFDPADEGYIPDLNSERPKLIALIRGEYGPAFPKLVEQEYKARLQTIKGEYDPEILFPDKALLLSDLEKLNQLLDTPNTTDVPYAMYLYQQTLNSPAIQALFKRVKQKSDKIRTDDPSTRIEELRIDALPLIQMLPQDTQERIDSTSERYLQDFEQALIVEEECEEVQKQITGSGNLLKVLCENQRDNFDDALESLTTNSKMMLQKYFWDEAELKAQHEDIVAKTLDYFYPGLPKTTAAINYMMELGSYLDIEKSAVLQRTILGHFKYRNTEDDIKKLDTESAGVAASKFELGVMLSLLDIIADAEAEAQVRAHDIAPEKLHGYHDYLIGVIDADDLNGLPPIVTVVSERLNGALGHNNERIKRKERVTLTQEDEVIAQYLELPTMEYHQQLQWWGIADNYPHLNDHKAWDKLFAKRFEGLTQIKYWFERSSKDPILQKKHQDLVNAVYQSFNQILSATLLDLPKQSEGSTNGYTDILANPDTVEKFMQRYGRLLSFEVVQLLVDNIPAFEQWSKKQEQSLEGIVSLLTNEFNDMYIPAQATLHAPEISLAMRAIDLELEREPIDIDFVEAKLTRAFEEIEGRKENVEAVERQLESLEKRLVEAIQELKQAAPLNKLGLANVEDAVIKLRELGTTKIQRLQDELAEYKALTDKVAQLNAAKPHLGKIDQYVAQIKPITDSMANLAEELIRNPALQQERSWLLNPETRDGSIPAVIDSFLADHFADTNPRQQAVQYLLEISPLDKPADLRNILTLHLQPLVEATGNKWSDIVLSACIEYLRQLLGNNSLSVTPAIGKVLSKIGEIPGDSRGLSNPETITIDDSLALEPLTSIRILPDKKLTRLASLSATAFPA